MRVRRIYDLRFAIYASLVRRIPIFFALFCVFCGYESYSALPRGLAQLRGDIRREGAAHCQDAGNKLCTELHILRESSTTTPRTCPRSFSRGLLKKKSFVGNPSKDFPQEEMEDVADGFNFRVNL
jgi:hypothetical protein